MAATMSAPRVPFGELSTTRLEQLSATKNCQNAVTELLAKGPSKSLLNKTPLNVKGPTKRPISAAIFADEDDAENVDPASHQAKRTKGPDGTPSKKTKSFLLDVIPNSTSKFEFSKPMSRSVRPITPPTAAPRSAPAGRSPKHKRVGLLSRKRIDPPAFGSRKGVSSATFSIDAALSGTLTPSKPKAPRGDGMPKGWFFEIHEDTPEQEAAIVMEHSTAILDLSSDDEAQSPKKKCGKENVPPPEYDEIARTMGYERYGSGSRRLNVSPAQMDDGERSPLGGLAAEDYFGKGLNAFSVETVADEEEKEEIVAMPSVEGKLELAEAMDVTCPASTEKIAED